MGADSAAVSGFDMTIRKDPKIFRNGDMLIGYTSSFRMGQLLGFKLQIPKRHQDIDLFRYMATEFVDAVRECLRVGGYTAINSNREDGGEFLVGTEGRLFRVYSDFQVEEAATGFNACGCGQAYALGAMAASAEPTARGRVLSALAIAEQFNAGVRGPFSVETL